MRFITAALAILLLAGAHKALAQQPCGPALEIMGALARIGEKLAVDAQVKTPQGLIHMRVFAHPRTGTWTMITLPDDSRACLVAVGENFTASPLASDPI